MKGQVDGLNRDMLRHESDLLAEGFQNIAGVDEAGRGPLAGPVVSAAVILPPGIRLDDIDDSKKLSPKARDRLMDFIHQEALAVGIAVVDERVIDEINILQASRLAMKQAVEKLPLKADFVLIDGNQQLDIDISQKALVKGDSLSQSIAAGSIVAKVTRDRLMQAYHKEYPQYGFNSHKGYPTKLHKEQIRRWGPCPIHRKTFAGVKEFIANDNR